MQLLLSAYRVELLFHGHRMPSVRSRTRGKRETWGNSNDIASMKFPRCSFVYHHRRPF